MCKLRIVWTGRLLPHAPKRLSKTRIKHRGYNRSQTANHIPKWILWTKTCSPSPMCNGWFCTILKITAQAKTHSTEMGPQCRICYLCTRNKKLRVQMPVTSTSSPTIASISKRNNLRHKGAARIILTVFLWTEIRLKEVAFTAILHHLLSHQWDPRAQTN